MKITEEKPKRKTKKQLIETTSKVIETELRDNYIKNMIQGREIAFFEIRELISKGYSATEIEEYIDYNIKNIDTFKSIALESYENK